MVVLLLLNICNHGYAFSHDYGGDDIAAINLNFKDKQYLIKYTSSSSLCRSYSRDSGKWKSEEIYTATADDCLMRITESFSSESDGENQKAIKSLLFGLIIRLFVFVSFSWVFRLISSVFANDF